MEQNNQSALHTLNNDGVQLFRKNKLNDAVFKFRLANNYTGTYEMSPQENTDLASKRNALTLSSLQCLETMRSIFIDSSKGDANQFKLVQSRFDEGFNTFPEVFEIDERMNFKSPTILYNIGKTYQLMDKHEDALCFYYSAIAQTERMPISDQKDLYTILAILHSVGQIHYFHGQLNISYSAYSTAAELAKENMGYANLITASSLNCMGVLKYHMRHEPESIINLLKESLRLRNLLLGNKHKDAATTLNNLGRVYFRQGNYSKAISAYEDALLIRTITCGTDHLDVAATYFNLGQVYDFKRSSSLSTSCYMEFLRISHFNDFWNDSEVANVLLTLGQNFYDDKNSEQALSFFKNALSIQLNVFGEKNEHVASTLNKLGNLYFEEGNYAAANEHYQKELLIEIEVCGIHSCNAINTLINIAEIYKMEKDYNQSLDVYKRVLEIQNNLQDDHANIFITLCNVGYLYYQMKDFSEALKTYYMALRIRLKITDKGDSEAASVLTQIGLIFLKLNEWRPALKAFHKSLRLQKNTSCTSRCEIAHNLYNIAVIMYQNTCDVNKALKYFERALKIEIEIHGHQHTDVAMTLFHIGQIHLQCGKLDEALKSFREALDIQRNSFGENHIAVVEILSSIGNIHVQRGEIDKLVQIFSQISRIYREIDVSDRNFASLHSSFYLHKYYSEATASSTSHAAAAAA